MTTLPPPDDPWAVPSPSRGASGTSSSPQTSGSNYPRQPGYAFSGGPGATSPHIAAPCAPSHQRSLRGLGTTTVALLAVQAVLAVAAAAVAAWGVLSWSVVSGASPDVRLPSDQADLLLTALRAPLSALTGIAFVAWLWTATANARSAGARVRHAPGWALGAWFVPVLNLWRPKQMVDDVWRASAPGVPTGIDLRFVRKPVGVACWWAAYLVGASLPAVAPLQTMAAVLRHDLDAITSGATPSVTIDMARINETSAMLELWGSVLLVVAAGLAVHFIHHVTRWQDERIAPVGAPLRLDPTSPY